MGRIAVPMEFVNNDAMALARRGMLPADRVRRETIEGIVDSGAAKLVLPQALVKKLGLAVTGKIRVRNAGDRTRLRGEAEGARVELLGRHEVFAAIVEQDRKNALIGAIVLEDLDLLVD